MSKFQMFPRFDASTITITMKANVNTKTEDTLKYLTTIEKDLFKKKDAFYIDHVGSVAGWRRDSAGNSETYPYVGQIHIELQKLKAQNFVDKYITPTLSFYYDKEGRTRKEESVIIAEKLRHFLEEKGYKKHFKLSDLAIVEKKVGPIKSDIKIGLVSNNNTLIVKYAEEIKKALKETKGIVSVNDAMHYGRDEIKLKVNTYGESLGLNEQKLGILLSNAFLERRMALSFDNQRFT